MTKSIVTLLYIIGVQWQCDSFWAFIWNTSSVLLIFCVIQWQYFHYWDTSLVVAEHRQTVVGITETWEMGKNYGYVIDFIIS